MAENAENSLKIGALVNIRNSSYRRGKIMEYRGPLRPGGAHIYRVRVRHKLTPTYVEFREDPLEIIPASSATVNKELTAANSVSNRLKVSLSTAFGGFDARKFATA